LEINTKGNPTTLVAQNEVIAHIAAEEPPLHLRNGRVGPTWLNQQEICISNLCAFVSIVLGLLLDSALSLSAIVLVV
jgi:hypothetical protein